MALADILTQIEQEWLQAGGTLQTAPQAAAIAYAESGGIPNGAICYDYIGLDGLTHCSSTPNPAGATGQADVGLFGIGTGGPAGNRGTIAQLQDPNYNIQQAMQISGAGKNWGAWASVGGANYNAALPVAQQVAQLLGLGGDPTQALPVTSTTTCGPPPPWWFLANPWYLTHPNSAQQDYCNPAGVTQYDPNAQVSGGNKLPITAINGKTTTGPDWGYWPVLIIAGVLILIGLAFIVSADSPTTQILSAAKGTAND